MSVSKTIHLVCDWPGCSNEINTGVGSLARGRDYAAQRGWLTVVGLDLCGPGRGQANHATLAAGHLPQTAQAPSGRVALSCQCGWAYPYAVDPVLVGNRWRMHLTDDVLTPSPASGGVS